MNFVWKTNEWEAESIVLLIFVLWWCFYLRWVRSCGVGQKVLLRARWNHILLPARILAEPISMTHSGMLYRLDISVLVLWEIAISDFRPLEIYKNLGRPLSTITFTVNSQADNHFYKYIYLFQMLYSIKSVFLLKCKLGFYI